jgi:endonuclease/exonuclease/phosphatase family metal-dependent hydrolase
VAITIVTWNLKGSAGSDLAAAADHLRAIAADVVVLQEVQRRQARSVATRLGARSVSWGFKHWPWRTWPEGMAVIGVTRRVPARAHALTYRWQPWSWRRRIYQEAHVPEGDATILLVNVHFSTDREAARRAKEVTTVVGVIEAADGPAILAGDSNDRPGSPLFATLAKAGLRDTWLETHPGSVEPDGATTWPGWRRCTTKPPTRRIDVVAVTDEFGIEAVEVPGEGDEGFEGFSCISDHLPVTATLSVGTPSSA